jgi:hypothetical protein
MRDAGVVLHERTPVIGLRQGSAGVTGVVGADRFDAEGRSRLAADPIALPFPEAVLR